MNERQTRAFMSAANVFADLSYCNRRKVGCVIVKGDNIVAIGYNGTPPGADNTCEDENNQTLPSVIHAEHNALLKLQREGRLEDCYDSTVFVTAAPCINCATLLHILGRVKSVVFRDKRRDISGIEYLNTHGISTEQI